MTEDFTMTNNPAHSAEMVGGRKRPVQANSDLSGGNVPFKAIPRPSGPIFGVSGEINRKSVRGWDVASGKPKLFDRLLAIMNATDACGDVMIKCGDVMISKRGDRVIVDDPVGQGGNFSVGRVKARIDATLDREKGGGETWPQRMEAARDLLAECKDALVTLAEERDIAIRRKLVAMDDRDRLEVEREAAAENARRERDRAEVAEGKLKSVAGFLDAIHTATPNGEYVEVQHHPDGGWSVCEKPAKPRCRVVTSPRFYSDGQRETATNIILDSFDPLGAGQNPQVRHARSRIVDAVATALGMRRAGQ